MGRRSSWIVINYAVFSNKSRINHKQTDLFVIHISGGGGSIVNLHGTKEIRFYLFFLTIKINQRLLLLLLSARNFECSLLLYLIQLLNLKCPLHSKLVLFLLVQHEIGWCGRQLEIWSSLRFNGKLLVRIKPYCEVLKCLYDLWQKQLLSFKTTLSKIKKRI